eukprot:gnl/MRDRNA2_/MRDRNA2_87116_c0_seq1.p1 gnl/MRDRNA2_/MRDRNA2_87116_c0~~gnl/MRDRNA2_/MRDRNA2_87116_c0_seq1.p1  ORF type:complete len:259 (+),score=28.40 gnl/MRDRNA2_/MRDRNA2_87116_c0_seq1:76-777(+)
MTNPGGLAPDPVLRNLQKPLFLRKPTSFKELRESKDILRPVDKACSHQQVWPFSLRECPNAYEFRRTAAVKHPLRAKCATPEKYSTYDHDYGVYARPRAMEEVPPRPPSIDSKRSHRSQGSQRSMGSRHSSGARSTGELSMFRTANANDLRDQFNNQELDFLHPSAHMTLTKLGHLNRTGKGLQCTTAGWGDCVWSPANFPSQIMGTTDKQINLIQTVHTLNLRSPDWTNTIR